MNYSLNQLYEVIGVTKQAVHGQITRYMKRKDIEYQVLKLVNTIRSDHPTMGVRQMYFMMKPDQIGRDNFEDICRLNGLTVEVKRNYFKTTDSSGVERFDNLLEGLKITRPNQVWQSDITYYRIGSRFHYITLIQDAFTKIIVGHSASKRLKTNQTTLPALRKAYRTSCAENITGIIFHSDGGGQYYSREFLLLTKSRGVINSMGKDCYENAMAESLNGVIKNKYLHHRGIKNFSDLQQEVDRTVQLYNHEKPHTSLNRLTPVQFKERWVSLSNQTNASMKKSADATYRMNGASNPFHTNQTNATNQNVTSTIMS